MWGWPSKIELIWVPGIYSIPILTQKNIIPGFEATIGFPLSHPLTFVPGFFPTNQGQWGTPLGTLSSHSSMVQWTTGAPNVLEIHPIFHGKKTWHYNPRGTGKSENTCDFCFAPCISPFWSAIVPSVGPNQHLRPKNGCPWRVAPDNQSSKPGILRAARCKTTQYGGEGVNSKWSKRQIGLFFLGWLQKTPEIILKLKIAQKKI